MDKLIRFLSRLGRSVRLDLPSPTTSSVPQAAVQLDHPELLPESVETSLQSSEQAEDGFVCSVNRLLEHLVVMSTSHSAESVCFWVNHVFTRVPGVSDPILLGTVFSGQLTNNQLAWLGPDQVSPVIRCCVYTRVTKIGVALCKREKENLGACVSTILSLSVCVCMRV